MSTTAERALGAGWPAGGQARRAPSSPGVDPGVGLDREEAANRLVQHGPNALPPPHRDRLAVRLLRQLREPMALLLLVAAVVSGFALGERVDGIAIAAIVVLNAVIGLVQEGKAARALEALRNLETPSARVRRSGVTVTIPAAEVVPGDVVLLAAGDRVPADLEMIQTSSLETDESLLTGESLPVTKRMVPTDRPPVPLADQDWMAFAGTLVTRGSGTGIVVATGPGSQLGRIAAALHSPQPPTPLQVELGRLTSRLGVICLAVAGAVFALTLARIGIEGESLRNAFLAAVALAVAAVPEGLATVVTVALALGVRRMAGQGAIVRRLPAVETLGCTTVIATDKTGTLTENRLRLEAVALPGRAPQPIGGAQQEDLQAFWEVAVLCNDADLAASSGDPLDVALLEAAGAERVRALRFEHPRVAELPFESERRRMTTLHHRGTEWLILEKGAPENVLPACSRALEGRAGEVSLSEADRAGFEDAAGRMAARGMRVLAFARRGVPSPPSSLDSADLTLVGLAGLRDPVRPEARAAVERARTAGIRIVMVTGDHPGTAATIASEAGLSLPEDGVVTGSELRERGFPQDPAATSVYARLEPDQKLALVAAMQERGEVVAVTGDGVNDAPALRRADIGVAMGLAGSDVARQAADMVVTDDNLATIISAVREGRGIYDNIRKLVDYLVAGNLSEITVVVASLVLFPAIGVPLLPLQLLWINLLTDGLPALALGVDPPDGGLVRKPPRSKGDQLLGLPRLRLLAGRGLVIASAPVASLAVERFVWHEPWAHARALMFTVLVVAHLLYAFVARRPAPSMLSNLWLVAAVTGGILLQLGVVAVPAAHAVFATAPLLAREWLLVLIGGVTPALALTLAERDRSAKPEGAP